MQYMGWKVICEELAIPFELQFDTLAAPFQIKSKYRCAEAPGDGLTIENKGRGVPWDSISAMPLS